jgi:predicted HAD superfamily Cof-like phosphohydrolase
VDHFDSGLVDWEIAETAGRIALLSQSLKHVFKKSRDQRALRAELLLEELGEALFAMSTRNEIELADGLADLLYVTFGTFNQFAIPAEPVFAEVHRSNMTKSSGAADHNGDKGKTDSFSRADIRSVLNAYFKES